MLLTFSRARANARKLKEVNQKEVHQKEINQKEVNPKSHVAKSNKIEKPVVPPHNHEKTGGNGGNSGGMVEQLVVPSHNQEKTCGNGGNNGGMVEQPVVPSHNQEKTNERGGMLCALCVARVGNVSCSLAQQGLDPLVSDSTRLYYTSAVVLSLDHVGVLVC